MKFLYCKVIKDNGRFRTYKLISDLETATLILDKKTWTTTIKGFEDTLKYVYPKSFVDNFVIQGTKNRPDDLEYAYGRG